MSLVSRVLRSKPSVRALARCAEVTRTVSVKSGKKPDPYSKHKRLLGLYDIYPHVGEMTYVAHNATLTGEVYTADNVTIWDRAVIRGDLNAVRIHHNAVIREGVSISTVSSLPIGLPSIVSIGEA
jgi:UDP-3-O-[3-hydroxymyristoyl] glucosamine N-acyltransferase